MKDTNPKDSVAQNKVPLGLVSPVAMAHEALALKAGAVKYGTANYRVMGANAMVYAHAALRHLEKWINGEEFDEADGTHHLGNVRACTAILLDCQHLGNLTDDRPPSMDLGYLFSELEQTSEELNELYADKKPYHYTIKDSTGKPAFKVEIEAEFVDEDVAEGTIKSVQEIQAAIDAEDAEVEHPKPTVGQRIVTKANAWYNPGKPGVVTKTNSINFAVLFDEAPSDYANGGIWYSHDEWEPEPVVEEKPKFKVGDKVKVISCPELDFVGKFGVITDLDDDKEYPVTVDFDPAVIYCGGTFNDWFFHPEELETVDLTLRVGAKVKVVAGADICGSGHTTKVRAYHANSMWPYQCENGTHYAADELEVLG